MRKARQRRTGDGGVTPGGRSLARRTAPGREGRGSLGGGGNGGRKALKGDEGALRLEAGRQVGGEPEARAEREGPCELH